LPKKERKEKMTLNCAKCNWLGSDDEGIWNDLSCFGDDSFCSNQEDSGYYECPECGDICIILEQ
jgi:predicted RNA-binding Zn-ribbon protein involved in translation (DUF1610 family)